MLLKIMHRKLTPAFTLQTRNDSFHVFLMCVFALCQAFLQAEFLHGSPRQAIDKSPRFTDEETEASGMSSPLFKVMQPVRG